MNVILVVSDTLRYDCVGYHGVDPYRWDIRDRPRTPHIDRFAASALVFDRAYTGSFPTIPMRTDMVTGKLTFPFRGWTPLPADETILADELTRQEGDRAITDDVPVVPPCDPAKQRLPERHLRCHLKWRTVHWQCEEDTFVAKTMRDACRWLERNYTHPNFFLWVDTFDPHEPWDPPPYYVDMYDPGYEGQVVDHPLNDYQDFLTPEELRHCRALYAGEVTLVDTWMGRLLETIDHLGLYDDTAVFFLSDHGYYIGDHGRVGKAGFGPDGPFPFYQEVNHIVMMGRIPGGVQGGRVDALVQPADIMPTVLDLVGLDAPEGLHGISLAPAFYGRPIPQREVIVTSPGITGDPERPECAAITDGEWTLQYRGPRYPSELYHLPDDPFMQRDVYAQERGQAQRLHRAYVDLLRQVGTDEAKVAARGELP